MASSSLLRPRFRFREADPAMDVDGWSEGEGKSDAGDDDAELESMTGKGIKRMCSELLELKKAADEDFEINVYSSYSTFIRIYEEVGIVESELMELEQLLLTQGKHVQLLASSLYSDTFSYDLKDDKVEDLALSSNSSLKTRMQDTLEYLDVLLLEHRLEEALAVLEKETVTSKMLQNEENISSPFIMDCTYALSERRKMLADQFVLMAEHPRVVQPELQKLLSGLCKLGENHRANLVLLKVYRSRIQESVHELQGLKSCLNGIYTWKLAKVVFSAISQAAKCYKILNGETAPYTSELIQWAREETETFSANFCTHVKFISQMNGSLSMVVEAVINAISFCSLLKPQKIVSQSILMELIRPCMEEALQMYVDHFREDIHMFTITDNWDLGVKSSLTGFDDRVEYYLLTSSGSKFVALIQEIVDDMSPLFSLQTGSSILKSLSDLFIEYISALERAIPSKETAAGHDSPITNCAQSLKQQLSLLVNSSTLVPLSSSIAGSLAKDIKSLNNGPSSDHLEIFGQEELDNWMLSIQEATDQLRGYFCRQFVYGVISHGYFDSGTSLDGWCIPSSSQDPVPSLAFQALFMQLRHLKELANFVFIGMIEMTEKLPAEIVMTVIVWISENQAFWTKAVKLSSVRQCSCLKQVQLDIHFIMEIARIGEYFSDDLMEAAMDLITQLNAAFSITESDSNCAAPDEGWAIDAARLAIGKLLEIEVTNSESEEEPAATSEEDLSAENWETKYLSDTENSIGTSDGSTVLNESTSAVDGEITRLLEQVDVATTNKYDDGESRTSTIQYADEEDSQDATNSDAEAHGIDGTHEIKELKDVESIDSLDKNDAKADKPQKHVAKGDLVWGAELLELDKFRELETIEDQELEWLATNPEADSVNLALEIDFLEADGLRVMEGFAELKLEGLATDSQVGSVSNLQACDVFTAQLAKEEPLSLGGKENMFLESEMDAMKVLEVEGLDGSDANVAQLAGGKQRDTAKNENHGSMRNPINVMEDIDINVTRSNGWGAEFFVEVYSIPSDNQGEAPRPDTEKISSTLDEFPQLVTNKQHDITKSENHGHHSKLLEVSNQPAIPIIQSDGSANFDNNPSKNSLEAPERDTEIVPVPSEGILHVDGSKNNETAMSRPDNREEVDKVLSTKFSELAFETSEDRKSSYIENSLATSRNTFGDSVGHKIRRKRRTLPLAGENSLGMSNSTLSDSVREKSGRKRRTLSLSEENIGNNVKGSKALRPQWH